MTCSTKYNRKLYGNDNKLSHNQKIKFLRHHRRLISFFQDHYNELGIWLTIIINMVIRVFHSFVNVSQSYSIPILQVQYNFSIKIVLKRLYIQIYWTKISVVIVDRFSLSLLGVTTDSTIYGKPKLNIIITYRGISVLVISHSWLVENRHTFLFCPKIVVGICIPCDIFQAILSLLFDCSHNNERSSKDSGISVLGWMRRKSQQPLHIKKLLDHLVIL